MNIQDKLSEIDNRFAGTYKKELLDLWMYLHSQERPEPILQVKLLHPNAKVPTRGSAEAIGWDLYALTDPTSMPIPAGEYRTMGTGISIAIPHGYYGRVAPRSGLALKQGVDILAGVIDQDFRGEVRVIVSNFTNRDIIVDTSKPIAQLILERADLMPLMVVSELQETLRGSGGFGSTDKVKETSQDDPTHT